jgi:large subunit ribosomal protein L24
MKLKKGDSVIIIKGKDKGRKGKIEKVFLKTGKVLIPGINVYKKHARKQSEKKPGGIIEIVKPLSLANVALFCSKCKKPTRIGYQIDKSGTKIRICRKCQAPV